MAKSEICNNSIVPQLLNDSCRIINDAQKAAYYSVNVALIKRNWLLGKRINEEILKNNRAEYGKQMIDALASVLVKKFGNGFTKSNLYYYVSFATTYPDIFHAVSGKYDIGNIFHAVIGKSDYTNWNSSRIP